MKRRRLLVPFNKLSVEDGVRQSFEMEADLHGFCAAEQSQGMLSRKKENWRASWGESALLTHISMAVFMLDALKKPVENKEEEE